MSTALPNNDELVQEEILRAALRLYRKHGPNKVTMDDVATATGRSRTSLYYYFKNRDEIFQAVIDTIVKDMTAIIRNAVLAAGNLNERLYAFCLAKLKASDEWKTVLKMMWASLNDDEKSKHSKMMSALHTKLLYQEGVIINEMLATAVSQREIRNISAGERDTLAFIISSSIRGIRNEIYDQHDPHDIKTTVRQLSDIISKWLTG